MQKGERQTESCVSAYGEDWHSGPEDLRIH